MKKNLGNPILAAVLAFVLAACGGSRGPDHADPPPVPVAVSRVEPGHAVYYDEYPATVTALDQVELRAEVSGYITGIFFRDGQHVHKGMKLYAIDQQQYKAAYDQAAANLNVARANLAKAQQDADRYNELAKEDAVARQTLEHSQEDLEAAKMQVAAAEATVQNADANLRYATIVAPLDGTIGISSVKAGSTVAAGQTLLNTVSSDDPIGVECAVDQKVIGFFTRLLDEKPSDSTFSLVLPDQSLYPSSGKLIVLDRAVDPQTGTIRVRAAFPNPTRSLKPGLTCNLRVRANSSASALLLPYEAVVEQMGEYFVFVVNGSKVSQRRVSLGMRINDMVIAKDGLKQGDLVVVEGVQKLRDNSAIVIKPSVNQPALMTPAGK